MSYPIEDYAIIGDTRSTALVHKSGSIDWLCWPRHDSPAVFLRLLDDFKGGFSDITFDEPVRTTRRYLPETNILETTFVGPLGTVVLVDFMPLRLDASVPATGPDTVGGGQIIRMLSCTTGHITGRFRTRPTFDFARKAAHIAKSGSAYRYICGDDTLSIESDTELHAAPEEAVDARFHLSAGQTTFLVIRNNASPQFDVSSTGLSERLAETQAYWINWSSQCTYTGDYRDAVLRSILVLKLLTYSPTGAIIAAPTLGLPEAIPGDRNYDYRFSWLRDASFSVTSFVNLGYLREASEYLRLLCSVDSSQGKALKLLYAIDGEPPGEETLPHLAGWRAATPITVGNCASAQTQTDIYGEFLSALLVCLEAIDCELPDDVIASFPNLVFNLAESAIRHRDVPDHGIWEMRTGCLANLHSRAMIYVALDRAGRIGGRLGLDEMSVDRWRDVARSVRQEYTTEGWNDELQAYVQSYGSSVLDAAVMRVVLFDALDSGNPRMTSTLSAIERNLVDGDLVYRYRIPDGRSGTEATFTACAFWRLSAIALAGDVPRAVEIFERLLQRLNDLGLYAEEIDVATGEQRGNFPQAFTHMAVVNHAVRLDRLRRGDKT